MDEYIKKTEQRQPQQHMDSLNKYVTSSEEIAFEYELINDQKSLVTWERYFEHIKESQTDPQTKLEKLCFCFERCLKQIPDNPQLWLTYLDLLNDTNNTEKYVRVCQDAVENCKVNLEIWVLYLTRLLDLKQIEGFNKAFAKSLKVLPLDEHISLWTGTILKYIKEIYFDVSDNEDEPYDILSQEYFTFHFKHSLSKLVGATKTSSEETVEVDKFTSFYIHKYAHLISLRHDSESQLFELYRVLCHTKDYSALPEFLEKYIFKSKKPASLYFQYLVCQLYSDKVGVTEVETLITQAIQTYSSERAKFILLLCHLQVVRKGDTIKEFYNFMNTLYDTISDVGIFNEIYEFSISVEDTLVSLPLLGSDKELHIEKLERLITNYNLALNYTKIKKTPNKISLWEQRAEIGSKHNIEDKISVYNQALLEISPVTYELESSRTCSGKGRLGDLWTSYAHVYFVNKEYESFRQVLGTAIKVPFKYLEDLESIYLYWSERELELGDFEQAINVLQRGLKYPEKFDAFLENAELILHNYYTTTEFVPVQVIFPLKSFKIWNRLVQIYEIYKTREETNVIYDAMLKIKIAKPETLVSFAESNYKSFEKWSSIYNKALNIFEGSKSVIADIYDMYIGKLLTRLDPFTKIYDREFIRDVYDNLFQDLEHHGIDCTVYYLQYADLELKMGNHRTTLRVLHQGITSKNVNILKNKTKLWAKYLDIASSTLTSTETRKHFEECLLTLPNSVLDDRVIQYTEFEIRTEANYVRARSILRFGTECGPVEQHSKLWDYWKVFELKYGNKETFKEMLRLKRIVGDKFVVDTQKISHMDNNIQFVSSGTQGGSAKNDVSRAPQSMEIELDI